MWNLERGYLGIGIEELRIWGMMKDIWEKT